MLLDMHVHTSYSDSSMSPGDIAALGARLRMDAIAITDHDTAAGWDEAEEAGKVHGLKIIKGIEISAFDFDRGRKVHILGYDMKDRETLEKECRPFLISRHKAQLQALKQVIEAGYPISEEEVLAYTGKSRILYRQHIMHALVDRGYATAIYGGLYKRLFGKDGIAFVKSEYMDVFDALKLILDTGGKAVLAHPYQYDSIDIIAELEYKGLSGIETGSSKHTDKQTADLMELADTFGLEQYQGTDFHGFYGEKAVPLGSL